MGQMAPKITIIQNIGIGFFGHFLSNRAETQETILHRLVIRNHSLDAFLEKIIFFARKLAWPLRWCRKVWGLKTRPKSWPTRWTFWVNRYIISKTCFQKYKMFNTKKYKIKAILTRNQIFWTIITNLTENGAYYAILTNKNTISKVEMK